MSEQKREEQVRSEHDEDEVEDLEVSEEEAEDVKGGQEMPPFPRQQR